MTQSQSADGIRGGRLSPEAYGRNFSDLHPALDLLQAHREAERCHFCDDAPCTKACPTGIDVPMFIRKILTGNREGAGETIFRENILGAICARVCPTETLCEGACVRHDQGDRPVAIGQLQRFATDPALEKGEQPFQRQAPTGKRVAIVGAGPAGLACAHALARFGHEVTIFDAKSKPGGLNTYGLARYKTPDDFAQQEIQWLVSLGGITIKTGVALGRDVTLSELRRDHDAVFLGLGLTRPRALGIPGEDLDGVWDALAYIENIREATDLASLPVPEEAVVIGGGMTAIDIAVQLKRLGCPQVTIAYRRGREQMKASDYEQELALSHNVSLRTHLVPQAFVGENGRLTGVTFQVADTGKTVTLPAQMAFKAIGQAFDPAPLGEEGPVVDGGRIRVSAERRTSLTDVWAGGDCIGGPEVAGREDLTVWAVQDGKLAARAIDAFLRGA